MSKTNRLIVGAAVVLVAASLAMARAGASSSPRGRRPPRGRTTAPAAEVGKKPAEGHPWSTTTVASSIMRQPGQGRADTVIGEVIDLSCYNQVGKHGDKHRDCGQKCARNGQPLGLLAKDGSVYMLVDEEHNPRRDGLTSSATSSSTRWPRSSRSTAP